jgi:hypothetical protein
MYPKEKYEPSSGLRPKLPEFNWGGVIVILAMVLVILGMWFYQKYFV